MWKLRKMCELSGRTCCTFQWESLPFLGLTVKLVVNNALIHKAEEYVRTGNHRCIVSFRKEYVAILEKLFRMWQVKGFFCLNLEVSVCLFVLICFFRKESYLRGILAQDYKKHALLKLLLKKLDKFLRLMHFLLSCHWWLFKHFYSHSKLAEENQKKTSLLKTHGCLELQEYWTWPLFSNY